MAVWSLSCCLASDSRDPFYCLKKTKMVEITASAYKNRGCGGCSQHSVPDTPVTLTVQMWWSCYQVTSLSVDMESTKNPCVQNLNFLPECEHLACALGKEPHGLSFFEPLGGGPCHGPGHILGAAGTRGVAWCLTVITTDALRIILMKGDLLSFPSECKLALLGC